MVLNMDHDSLINKANNLPDSPGIYIMKDALDEILYIGKAISLKNRVRQYFRNSSSHSQRVASMVEKVMDFEIILTDSELEAFMLEYNLIKQHKPKYNIMLKDDKGYSYIKVTVEDEYPKILFTRRVEKDKSKYYGPFLRSKDVRETLKIIREIFPIRSCSRKIGDAVSNRPCLYFHINQCQGLCMGNVDKNEYKLMVKQVCRFLEGKYNDIIKELKNKMLEAAEGLQFERAVILRNRIEAINRIMQDQKIVTKDSINRDVLAIARNNGEAVAQILYVRNGALTGGEHFVLDKTENADISEVLEAFIKQFYIAAVNIPKEILLQQPTEELKTLSVCLSQIKESKVRIYVPLKGEKKELVDMALRNAQQSLNDYIIRSNIQNKNAHASLEELAQYINAEKIPYRIEAFDISNLQGTESVGSMVVFENGAPKQKDYRRFRIRGLNGVPDDFASIAQTVERRFARGKEEIAKLEDEKKDIKSGKFSILPDLVMVDGGKGQLSAALDCMRKLGIDGIQVIGLAKEMEEVFVEGESLPVIIPRDSKALHLLQRIRDEAHRFAITYHRSIRNRSSLHSILEDIPNIGKKRRIALFKHFGSVQAIKAATFEELENIESMNKSSAKSIYEYFH